jgi:hypothetical protein
VFSRPVLIGRGLGILLLGVRVRSAALDQRLTSERADAHQISGGKSGGETPVPIPNTEVKTASADGTWGETPRESRSPPDLCHERPRRTGNACAGAFVALGTREGAPVLSPPCPDRRTASRGAGAAGAIAAVLEAPPIRQTAAGSGGDEAVAATSVTRSSGSAARKALATTSN